MTVAEIIDALTSCSRQFPAEALSAAMAQRAEITPRLLEILEDVAANPERYAREDSLIPLYAAYLLAYFRETRAYQPLTKIIAAPGDKVAGRLFGDMITERLKNILAAVDDGDPGPLKQLVESGSVDDFVRGDALNAFQVLVHTDQIPRETVVKYFRRRL
jgi:hypothetical protein